jgi:hypothetical protein
MRIPRDRRRWYQFSFKTLFVSIAMILLVCLVIKERSLRIQAEQERNVAKKLAEQNRAIAEAARMEAEMARSAEMHARKAAEEALRRADARLKEMERITQDEIEQDVEDATSSEPQASKR